MHVHEVVGALVSISAKHCLTHVALTYVLCTRGQDLDLVSEVEVVACLKRFLDHRCTPISHTLSFLPFARGKTTIQNDTSL